MYRIRPAVHHLPFKPLKQNNFTNDFSKWPPNPNQLRWSPFNIPKEDTDFVQVSWPCLHEKIIQYTLIPLVIIMFTWHYDCLHKYRSRCLCSCYYGNLLIRYAGTHTHTHDCFNKVLSFIITSLVYRVAKNCISRRWIIGLHSSVNQTLLVISIFIAPVTLMCIFRLLCY